jgi:hypothetical protein
MQVNGSYVLALPFSQSTVFPIIDMVKDYGMFVCEAIESPAFGTGMEILTGGELISFLTSFCNSLKVCDSLFILPHISSLIHSWKVTGEKISFFQVSVEEWIASSGLP